MGFTNTTDILLLRFINLFLLFLLFAPLLFFYSPPVLSESILCFLSHFQRKARILKHNLFLKMHVFSGFTSLNGLIVYGENVYKEYNRKKYEFSCCLKLTKKKKAEEKISQKVPVKGLPPSSYETCCFSCDCAMFFNIGYFI